MECKTDQTRAYVCMLLVTNACNLNCVYCYESHKSNKYMTLEVAQRAIQNAFEKEGFDYVSVQFMGGEPLLGFPLIKEISEWMWETSNPQPIGFRGILLVKDKNSFYCTYSLHNRNVVNTKSPYPIKRLEVIRWFNQKSMVFNQSLS